jgi:hypothetical protein
LLELTDELLRLKIGKKRLSGDGHHKGIIRKIKASLPCKVNGLGIITRSPVISRSKPR